MPSLKAIRKRIVRVKNTRKITSALKLVAAAKLRRSQDAIIAARPYSQALASVVSELAGVAGKDAHPLFAERELKNAAVVVVTSDRGLAGAFNSNVIRAVERFAANELSDASEVSLRIIGRKANQHFAHRNPRDRGLHRRQGRPRLPRLQRVQERRFADRPRDPDPARPPRREVDGAGREGYARAGRAAADRLPLRAEQAGAPVAARSALRPEPDLPLDARVDRIVLRRPDDGDGERDEERRRHDQALHASVQPRSSGGDHEGARRDRRRRRGFERVSIYGNYRLLPQLDRPPGPGHQPHPPRRL